MSLGLGSVIASAFEAAPWLMAIGRHKTSVFAQLRQAIKNNGFVAKAATIIARGTVSHVNGESAFEVAGTGERYMVSDSTAVTASTVQITGRVDLSRPDKPRLSELVSKPD